ncbi:MAG: bifunctional 4-hydroxy-2-oxoglutarate aldolase/2-dehydro-3-deoxy-phosphogluconate aldolase [Propionibacteriaceae bacterium]|nr:bifunctional 4-hydroxy-2-oxoglutarate aldolase/2-dehydro-3-deoxy-phosphogluconate aldolase [Propionibacteriaceae bacterium]
MSTDAETLQRIVGVERLVAIVRGTDIDATVAAATTLLDCGVRVLEIALTLEDAAEAIRQVTHDAPEGVLIGAGTAMTPRDVDEATEAGATFIVTPTFSAAVPHAISNGVGVLAGAYTPTEIQRVLDAGAAAAKLFPASALGPAFIKAVRDPLPGARIIPVGGVSLETIPPFLAAGAFAVGVGGPLLGDAATVGGDLNALRSRAAAFLRAVAG